VVLAREHDLEIREHSTIRAPPLERAEALARELRLGDERGNPAIARIATAHPEKCSKSPA
jgi:hypothetical protein